MKRIEGTVTMHGHATYISGEWRNLEYKTSAVVGNGAEKQPAGNTVVANAG